MHCFARFWRLLDRTITIVAMLYSVDRLIKHVAIERFFRRPPPKMRGAWPRVTMIHPVTDGTHCLAHALEARARLKYPSPIQHLFVCDANDIAAQRTCHDLFTRHPDLQGEIIVVPPPRDASVERKIPKLRAALKRTTGTVVCCIDDDVSPQPDALCRLIPSVCRHGVGAAFGVPYNPNWGNLWTNLVTGYINANTLYNYVVLSFLVEPYRVLGQLVAYPRSALAAIKDLAGIEDQIDDDYAIAQCLHAEGFRLVQTPVTYAIDEAPPTFDVYHRQMKRWVVLPYQAMRSTITPRQGIASLLAVAASFMVPSITAVLAVLTWRKAIWRALGAMLGVFGVSYAITQARYLHQHTPLRRWPVMVAVALITPLHVLKILISGGQVEWRGQRLEVQRDGRAKVIAPRD